MQEKLPRGAEWQPLPVPRVLWTSNTLSVSRWQRGAVLVVSALEDAELPGAGGASGPTWHVSISRLGKRPRPRDVAHALRDFGMVGAEQDNHHPGVAQHYFMPVDPAYRSACECKTTEDVIVEADGYTWTNPKLDAVEGCRGCEFERLQGKPCPIHQSVT
jgi:hypothetical protein